MSEPVQWEADGTPRSPRFGDIYRQRGAAGEAGLAQSRQVFLHGCGLPEAWRGQPLWQVLETGFGLGLNFLTTWQTWRDDPARPQRLHVVSLEAWPVGSADLLRGVAPFPELRPLAEALAAQWHGLLPGLHRLVFEQGRVQLTLGVGDAATLLRERLCRADTVFLDGFSPACNPDMWGLPLLKGVARNCRRGARLATYTVARAVRDGLTQCGFEVARAPGLPPKRDRVSGHYQPRWALPGEAAPPGSTAESASSPCQISSGRSTFDSKQALVVGAGLAGAAVACALARRGWQVTVLERADHPAAGASGLPAGLAVPHTSPDQNLLSRLTQAGLRATSQRAGECLVRGEDWDNGGVLEHCLDGRTGLPADWPAAGQDWSRPAGPAELAGAGLPAEACALWHPRAAWLRPAALVRAQLATPGVEWRGGCNVARLEPLPDGAGWRLWDAAGQCLGQAPLLVLASAWDTRALLDRLLTETETGEAPDPGHASPGPATPVRMAAGAGHVAETESPGVLCTPLQPALPLHALRGQVSWGPSAPGLWPGAPAMPVNGQGSFLPAVPTPEGPIWLSGATFERGQPQPLLRPEDQQTNAAKLAGLLPALAPAIGTVFARPDTRAWAGVRATLPDRLPAVGPLAPARWPGLQVCAGLGARGLSLAVLCGELLAAQLEGEPLPLPPRLARALAAARFSPYPETPKNPPGTRASTGE